MRTFLLIIVFFISACLSFDIYAFGRSDKEAHELDTSVELKGPNGGKLLVEGNFAVEVTIFESGIPPEMRLFAYHNNQLIEASKVSVQVTLDRLGGAQDIITFQPEKNYLVGSKEVVEPHSFDVTVEATFNHHSFQWKYQNYEGRSQITNRLLKLSNIKTERVKPQELTFKDTLFGVINIPDNKLFKLNAAYSGLIKNIHVQVGDQVKKGQRLATLLNTQTLQNYFLNSPADGEISKLMTNIGGRTDNKALIELIDLSQVWVELSAFPENIERLAIGQKIQLYDLHQHEKVDSFISYIDPQMTGGHIARARAVVSNPKRHWRPGMHIKADIQINQRTVSRAVKVSAIQSFRDMPVVFAKYGNTFEVRMLQLGESDGNYVEILGGIELGTEYVVENSFLLKADILKDGASHDH